jgi:hypothetical protein
MAQILVVIVRRVAVITLRLAGKILRLVRRVLSLAVCILRLAGGPGTGWMALVLFERVLKLARKALRLVSLRGP